MVLVALCICMQGCSLIDDDLSVCGRDIQMELQMQLVTNLDLELETVLTAETDVTTKQVLYDHFSHIFTDHAHDIHIFFYNLTNDDVSYSIHEVIDANQSTYTFFLPKDDYEAIALANLYDNGIVMLEDTAHSTDIRLSTPAPDTLPTQNTGVFAVEKQLEVLDSIDQKFELTLHMTNSALAIVIDTANVTVTGIRAYMTNTAHALLLRDSLYFHNKPKTVVMEEIVASSRPSPKREGVYSPQRPNKYNSASSPMQVESDTVSHAFLLGGVGFPSPDTPDADGTYYQAKLYVTLANGTTTETVLSVHEPLRAGMLKVIKAQLQGDGEVVPVSAPEVGVSVTLDWKDGGEHIIDL